LHPDGPKETFLHHAGVLHAIVDELASLDFEPAFQRLQDLYESAAAEWPAAAEAAGMKSMAPQWVDPLREGLRIYADGEGWL
jgi:hypothetical protein